TMSYEFYSGTCHYNNGYVYETGYSPRPMSAQETNLMVQYGNEWAQYGVQVARFALGRDTMPVPPVMPCFCHNCY
ncbi:hypothetical protein PFISCL1PPCAC_2225, partial [Pristionchus fissidentatus]